jgi:formate dehydrogenase subunit gamma
MQGYIERYRKPTIILHWVHTAAFVILFLTGLILFLPAPVPLLAIGSWSRLVHRIAAAVFIVAPAIYVPMNWKSTVRGIKEAFTWGSSDIGWLKAAPRYYFIGDESAMPTQGYINAGQRVWFLMDIVFGGVFVITGIIMWAFKTIASPAVINWSIFFHDVAFIATGTWLFVHIYLGVFHPLMTGSWASMIHGKVSSKYAESHYGKWYEQIRKNNG